MISKLFFRVERVDSRSIDIIFDNPSATKLAFRSIMKFLGDEAQGISLVRCDFGYKIVLDKEKGGWAAWRTRLVSMISDKFLRSDGKYYIEVCNDSLLPVPGATYAMVTATSTISATMSESLPMVIT